MRRLGPDFGVGRSDPCPDGKIPTARAVRCPFTCRGSKRDRVWQQRPVWRGSRAGPSTDRPGCTCYAPPSPHMDPWCSGPTCQPVTLEIAGSNPVGSAINAFSYAPSARPDGAFSARPRRGWGTWPARDEAPASERGSDATLWYDPDRDPTPRPRRPRAAGHRDRRPGDGRRARVRAGPIVADRRPARGPVPRRHCRHPARRRRVPAPRPPGDGDTGAAGPPAPRPRTRRRRTCRSSRSPSSGRRGRPRRSRRSRRSWPARALATTRSRLVGDETDAILAALGVDRPKAADRLIEAKSAAALQKDLAKHRKRLGFLRAEAVGPGVRALTWGGKSLFGNDRVTDLADWKLAATLPAAAADEAFDPPRRGPWSPAATSCSTAASTRPWSRRARARTSCSPAARPRSRAASAAPRSAGRCRVPVGPATREPSATSSRVPTSRWPTSRTRPRTSSRGIAAGRSSRRTRPSSTASRRPGFDVMGTANNHIRDQGANGLLQTLKNIRKRDIKTAGSGKDLAAARKPAVFDVDGIKVAILAYDAIAALVPRHRVQGRQRADDRQGRQGRRQEGPRGRRRRRHRLPALGHRVPGDAVGRAAQARPPDPRCRRRHDHRQPRALDDRDGGLQGQADLVRARATSSSTRPGPRRRWRG